MGKGTLLMVAAVIMSTTFFMISQKRGAQDVRATQNTYQYASLAKDATHSGLDHAVSQIRRMKPQGGTTIEGQMEGGSYVAEVTPSEYGNLEVKVTGTVGENTSAEALHTITTNLVYETPVDAAMGLDADSVIATGHAGGNFLVSGRDRRSKEASGRGYLDAVPAVRSKAQAPNQDMMNSPGMEGPETNWHKAGPRFDQQKLYEWGKAHHESAPSGGGLLGSLLGVGSDAGSPGNPKVTFRDGDLVGESVEGHGLLLVNGDFEPASLDWNGVIVVRKEKDAERNVTLDGGSGSTMRVNGSVMVFEDESSSSTGPPRWSPPGTDPDNEEECDPDFQIVNDELRPGDNYYARLDVMGTGLEQYDNHSNEWYDMPVTAEVVIGGETFEPWGAFDDPHDGNLNRDGQEGFTFQPTRNNSDEARAFSGGSGVRVNAASWQRTPKMVQRTRERRVCTRWSGWLWFRSCERYEYRTTTEEVWEGDYEWHKHMEMSSRSDVANLQVLQNGDSAPSSRAFRNQTDAQDYVREFITHDERIDLRKNQGINLFELGMDPSQVHSDAFDMQDLVVITSVLPVKLEDCNLADEGGASNGGSSGNGSASSPPPSPLRVKVKSGASVQYSPEAIAKIGKIQASSSVSVDPKADIYNRTQVVVANQKEERVGT